MPDNLSLSSLKSGTVPSGPKALRDMTFAISRVPRDILGNPVPRCCMEVVCRPSPAGGSHKFGRLIIFLHPLWTMEGWNMEGRQAAQITAYFFPAFSARRSFRRARAMRMMRCDAPLCNGRNLRASVPRPAALIDRAAQRSGSAASGGVVRVHRSLPPS